MKNRSLIIIIAFVAIVTVSLGFIGLDNAVEPYAHKALAIADAIATGDPVAVMTELPPVALAPLTLPFYIALIPVMAM